MFSSRIMCLFCLYPAHAFNIKTKGTFNQKTVERTEISINITPLFMWVCTRFEILLVRSDVVNQYPTQQALS